MPSYDFHARLQRGNSRLKRVNRYEAIYHPHDGDLTAAFYTLVSPQLAHAQEEIGTVAGMRVEEMWFGVDVVDLASLGRLPQAGDKIDLFGYTYQLAAADGGSPPYNYVTSQRQRFLLYTVQVGRSYLYISTDPTVEMEHGADYSYTPAVSYAEDVPSGSSYTWSLVYASDSTTTINPATGEVSVSSPKIGTFTVHIRVTDGTYTTDQRWTVRVLHYSELIVS